MLTKSKLHSVYNRFNGRITDRHSAHAEFTTRPIVLIPETTEDVRRALLLAKASGRDTFVRSGGHVSSAKADTSANAAIISLERFSEVSIDLQRVTVGAAATVGDVANALRHRILFMPLEDMPAKSMASALLGGPTPAFPHSVGRVALSSCIVGAEVVLADQVEAVQLDRAGWAAFQKRPDGVATRFILDASVWQKFGEDRWVRAWMLPYRREAFQTLCTQLFDRRAPAGVDIGLRVSSGAYKDQLVVIRSSGQGERRSEAARRFIQGAIDAAKLPVLWARKVEGAGSSVAAWVGAGPGQAEGERYGRYESSAVWGADEGSFIEDVDRMIKEGGWVDLHLGSLLRRAMVPSGAAPQSATFMGTGVAKTAKALVAGDPSAQFELAPTHVGGPIPGFKGEVFERSVGGLRYQKAIQQYATSSFDAATVKRRMTPNTVAVPVDSADVLAAVDYAVEQGLKVVARSGGHQYCGLSSGGDDTLLLDVQRMEQLSVDLPNLTATVGPGVALKDLTKALAANKVAIPHGECPLVNLGGHIQTGGVGHQSRCLGLALDWVRSFKLVTLSAQGAVEQTYQHPTLGNGVKPPNNDEIFRAVMGGGPGSWGVLTEITVEVVPDSAYPESQGYTKTYPYNRAGWAVAFDLFRGWIDREAAGTLPPGVDYFLSVISGNTELLPHANLRPAVLLVETTALHTTVAPEIERVVQTIAGSIPLKDKAIAKVVDLSSHSPNGPAGLSHIVDHGVRSLSIFGGMPGGREFDLPYKKSLYVSRDPLPKELCDRFVDLVDRVESHPGLKVVFQGVIGGGRFQENALSGASHMQHRDALAQIVFDIFYEPGYAAKAEEFQAEMRTIWLTYLPQERSRMFWGTFEDPNTQGAQLDMLQPDTQARYYDSPAEYAKLQRIKRMIDPQDVFHTSFTVQT